MNCALICIQTPPTDYQGWQNMADDIDRTQEDQEWMLKQALSLSKPEPRNGYFCATPDCHNRDDRIMAGYRFCETCMEERREQGL